MKGYLILETGDCFKGEWIGADNETTGEVVFQTGMTGYQEVLTDPSYAGQIVTFTYPLIGNYGLNSIDNQSLKPHVKAVIVSELWQNPDKKKSIETFEEVLIKNNISGISGIDTRELTKIIRKHGTINGIISKTNDYTFRQENCPCASSHASYINHVQQVSTKKTLYYPGIGPHIVVIDYGCKYSIVESLLKLNCEITVVPYNYPINEIKKLKPDGLLLSNGPGDPKDLSIHLKDIKGLATNYPTLGICLGHQILALAFGADTEKLPFGHRGVNHPVLNLENNKVWITSQNHGYVVKEDSIDKSKFITTYKNINDNSVEGMKHKYLPIQAVQFHPEAHPGPVEAHEIFTSFINQCRCVQEGEKQYV